MATKVNWNEIHFIWWLEEMQKHGLVISFEREPKTFHTMEPIVFSYAKHHKTKDKTWVTTNIKKVLSYTPDFKVIFSPKVINNLIGVMDIENKVILDFSEKFPGSGAHSNVYQDTLFYGNKNGVSELGEIEVWFDVKPPNQALRYSGSLTSSHTFPFNQRLVFLKHGIWVNKVVPIELYEKTFMPNRYRFTDRNNGPRVIKKEFQNIEKWMLLKKITKTQESLKL